MRFPSLLVAICILQVISTEAQSHKRKNVEKKSKRQTKDSADQMVQNIFQWLQGLYDSQNTRTIRQGALREYLPPANTENPRPFGYPPAGITPFPPFPGPEEDYPSSPGVFPNEILPPEPSTGQPEGPTAVPQFPSGYPGGQTETYRMDILGQRGETTTVPQFPSGYPGGQTGEPRGTTSVPQFPSSYPGGQTEPLKMAV